MLKLGPAPPYMKHPKLGRERSLEDVAELCPWPLMPPWIDPRFNDDRYPNLSLPLGSGIPVFSWVEHPLKTISKILWSKYTAASAFPMVIVLASTALLFHFNQISSLSLEAFGLSGLCLASNLPRIYKSELERCNTVYTLLDNGKVVKVTQGLFNLAPDKKVFDITDSVSVDTDNRSIHSRMGSGREITFTTRGGGPSETISYPPYNTLLHHALTLASNSELRPISPGYFIGLHWLGDTLEYFTKFANKTSTIQYFLNLGSDWADPGLRRQGDGFHLNYDYPTALRSPRENIHPLKNPDKLLKASVMLWNAWIHSRCNLEQGYRNGTDDYIQTMVRKSGGDNVYRAVSNAWNTGALSPRSDNWPIILKDLRDIMRRVGTFYRGNVYRDVVLAEMIAAEGGVYTPQLIVPLPKVDYS